MRTGLKLTSIFDSTGNEWFGAVVCGIMCEIRAFTIYSADTCSFPPQSTRLKHEWKDWLLSA